MRTLTHSFLSPEYENNLYSILSVPLAVGIFSSIGKRILEHSTHSTSTKKLTHRLINVVACGGTLACCLFLGDSLKVSLLKCAFVFAIVFIQDYLIIKHKNRINHNHTIETTKQTTLEKIDLNVCQEVKLDLSKWVVTTVTAPDDLVSHFAARVGDMAKIYQFGSASPIFMGNCRKIENATGNHETAAKRPSHLIDVYCNLFAVQKVCEKIQQRRRLYHLYAQGGNPVRGVGINHQQFLPQSPKTADRKKTVDGDQLLESEKSERMIHTFTELYGQLIVKSPKDFLKELTTVPEDIISPRDWLWHCSITNKPIRFIVRPAINLDELEEERSEEVFNICYEKEALERWMSEHIDQMPPNWPPELWPVKQGQKIYIKSKMEQQAIDKQLCITIKKVVTELGVQYKNLDDEEKGAENS